MGECPTTEFSFVLVVNTTDIYNLSYAIQENISTDAIVKIRFIAYGIISSIIIALGIIGNLINLVVLTRPNLKGVAFMYLKWLAISDLLTLVVSLTSIFRLYGIQPRSYAVAFYYAHIELPLVNSFMASSVFLVIALTIDRYFSVCLPTRFKEVHNVKRAKRSIVAAYSCAFLLYIPVGFQKTPIEVHFNNVTDYIACDDADLVTHTAYKIYILIKEALVRIGPVILLAFLNAAIIITFRKTLKKRKHLFGLSTLNTIDCESNQQREASLKKYREEQRLIILLAGIIILFFITMTPASILTILNGDDKEFYFGFQLFRAIANTLELSNYAMNFYVYCVCSSEIRRTFVALIRCTSIASNASSQSCNRSSESVKKH